MKKNSVASMYMFPIENSGKFSISGAMYCPPSMSMELRDEIALVVKESWKDAETTRPEDFKKFISKKGGVALNKAEYNVDEYTIIFVGLTHMVRARADEMTEDIYNKFKSIGESHNIEEAVS